MIDKDKYTPMECPICHEFYFSELIGDEVNELDYIQCLHCGWIYDADQHQDPDLSNRNNKLSLNEYSEWYKEQLKDNPNYDFQLSNYTETPHLCPICGRFEFPDDSSFDICPFCGWEDDGSSDDVVGANDVGPTEYKRRYLEKIAKNPAYKWEDSI